MSSSTPAKPLRTLCLTCSGSGDLDRHVARICEGKIITGIVIDECWFCKGEGWIPFGPRR